MSGHTPGPWVWVEPLHVLNSAHGKILDHAAYEGMWFARYSRAEDEANARLIAAAPDLLNALTVLADAAEARGMPCDAARAAIAKATGAQP